MSTTTTPAEPRQRRQQQKRVFRIVFVIEGVDYQVIPLQPDPAVAKKAYRFRKATGGPAAYDVHLGEHGPVCECLGFLRHGMGKDGMGCCKHIRTLVAAGMFPAPEPAQQQPAEQQPAEGQS